MRYHFTLVKMALIKKSTNSKCWKGCGEKGLLLHYWYWYSHYRRGYGDSLENWIKPPYDPASPLLGIYPEETKIEKDTCNPLFIAALFTIARTWKWEKAMATHSSTLAYKISWTEEPGRLQSMGLHRVGHDWAPSLSLSCIGEGNGNPLQCSCLENPRDGGAWWAPSMGPHRVGHDWSNLAAAAAAEHGSNLDVHWQING